MKAVQLENGQKTVISLKRITHIANENIKNVQHHCPLGRCKLKQQDTTIHLSE